MIKNAGPYDPASVSLFLNNTLCLHCIRNLKEACDIGTCDIVAFHIVLLGCFIKIMEEDKTLYALYVGYCLWKSVALLAHCVGDLLETGDVRTLVVVDASVALATLADTCIVDVAHDPVKLGIDFFKCP